MYLMSDRYPASTVIKILQQVRGKEPKKSAGGGEVSEFIDIQGYSLPGMNFSCPLARLVEWV